MYMLKAPHAQRDSRNVSKVRCGVFGCVRGYLHKVFLWMYTRHYTDFSMPCHEHYCKSVNITFIWYDTFQHCHINIMPSGFSITHQINFGRLHHSAFLSNFRLRPNCKVKIKVGT